MPEQTQHIEQVVPPIKQVIVIRHDLHMRLGKACAQASHASMMWLTQKLRDTYNGPWVFGDNHDYGDMVLTSAQSAWIEGIFTTECGKSLNLPFRYSAPTIAGVEEMGHWHICTPCRRIVYG